MLYLGTSGFSYDDWVGVFYPPGMPKREWLAYYAHHFNTCEINSTFYAIPRPQALAGMARRTGEGFLFVIKAHQDMTHKYSQSEEVFASFIQALQPLQAVGKLGGVLAQFPYSFSFTRPNWDYLRVFRERMAGLPLVIEFRHAGWLRPAVFEWLRRWEIGFCCVDEPALPNLMPPVSEATGPIAYVRFHGRNAAKWWQHQHAYERYDYTYPPGELAPWVPKIQKLTQEAERTFVFANNHFRGQAIATIRQIRTMLD